jgi:hypothetical protein
MECVLFCVKACYVQYTAQHFTEYNTPQILANRFVNLKIIFSSSQSSQNILRASVKILGAEDAHFLFHIFFSALSQQLSVKHFYADAAVLVKCLFRCLH